MERIGQLNYQKAENRYYIDDYSLSSGECLEVLICNGLIGKTEWIKTRIEYSHETKEYYLVDLFGYSMQGLFARID
ncbi:MAG: DUF5348 domain-containing protein [Clostridia bacterium]